jgi:hypothetical protein
VARVGRTLLSAAFEVALDPLCDGCDARRDFDSRSLTGCGKGWEPPVFRRRAALQRRVSRFESMRASAPVGALTDGNNYFRSLLRIFILEAQRADDFYLDEIGDRCRAQRH